MIFLVSYDLPSSPYYIIVVSPLYKLLTTRIYTLGLPNEVDFRSEICLIQLSSNDCFPPKSLNQNMNIVKIPHFHHKPCDFK